MKQADLGRLPFCCAFQNALHGLQIPLTGTLSFPTRTLPCVHLTCTSADESFVNFHFAFEQAAALLHCQSNALQHEPSGFLSHAKRTVKLVRANPVLAICGQPHRGKPLFQTNRRILNDSADFCRKLLLRVWRPALPYARIVKERHFVRSAARTPHAVRPADGNKELKSVLWIAEIRDCFEQGFRY